MQPSLSIAEPARGNLKQRLLNTKQLSSCQDIEKRVCFVEHIVHSLCLEKPMNHCAIQACTVADEIRAVLEEFILDTRAYMDHCAKLHNFLHFQPAATATVPPVSEEGASGWIAGLLQNQDDPYTIARVSNCLPGKPETYRLRRSDMEALVQRISARKQWRPALVRVWVGELERFLAIKSFTGDMDASKLSPSGYVDAMWHELIIDTHLYDTHCLALLGKFIHHNPDGAMDANRADRYAHTLSCYRQLFEQEPCNIAWDTATEAAAQQ